MAVKKYTVHTYLNGIEVDTQKVNGMEYLKDNDFVIFDREKELEENAGINFEGGDNGEVSANSHEEARNAFESYTFNTLVCPVGDEEEQKKYIDYTKLMRDTYGVKFQTVVSRIDERDKPINHEGIIEVGTTVANEDANPYDIVYWVAGNEASCRVQDSCVANAYTGNFTLSAKVNRSQMEDAINNGVLIFHMDGDRPVILKDINTLTDIEEKDAEHKHIDMRQNQTMRVLDYVVLESARIFNSMFLGRVPNDDIGRSALRSELLKVRNDLATIRAIAPYDEGNLNIIEGKDAVSVIGYDAIQPLNCMEKLYLHINFINF